MKLVTMYWRNCAKCSKDFFLLPGNNHKRQVHEARYDEYYAKVKVYYLSSSITMMDEASHRLRCTAVKHNFHATTLHFYFALWCNPRTDFLNPTDTLPEPLVYPGNHLFYISSSLTSCDSTHDFTGLTLRRFPTLIFTATTPNSCGVFAACVR